MENLKKNIRSAGVLGVVIGGIFLAAYPTIIKPYMDPSPWREIQQTARKGIDREAIQPGGMKVWTDPFERKDSK